MGAKATPQALGAPRIKLGHNINSTSQHTFNSQLKGIVLQVIARKKDVCYTLIELRKQARFT